MENNERRESKTRPIKKKNKKVIVLSIAVCLLVVMNAVLAVLYVNKGGDNVIDTNTNDSNGNTATSTVHEHIFGDWVVTKQPTTTEEGEQTRTCSGCGEEETEIIPKHVHTFGNWVVTKIPDENADGEKTRTCLGCGDKETEKITYVPVSTGLAFTSNGDGTCYVSGIGTCEDKNVVIPYTSPSGNMVTSIGNGAFYECTGLTSIVIPDSVTSIAHNAFYGCSGITSIEIPSSVTSIDGLAFCGCSGITSIEIPSSVIKIDSMSFSDCTKLTNIKVDDANPVYHSSGNCLIETESKTLIFGCNNSIIPSDGSVTSIDGLAFYGCTGLTSIEIPASITSIGYGVFNGCSGIVSITVDNGNTVYHSEGNCLIETKRKTLIAGCNNSVIPRDGSVTSIGDNAFYGCSGLTNIEIPNSVTSIGDDAFYGCSGLTNIEIPNSVTSIGDYAFCGCSGLTSIEIPDGITNIGYEMFRYCSGLTSITLPNSVTSIKGFAFNDCSNLSTVYYTGTSEQWDEISIGYSNTLLTSATRYYYSETAPTEAGNYWHYVDGVPTIW